MTIEHLVFFAGPPASGKTTVMDALLAGQHPDLAEQLELGDIGAWRIVNAADLGPGTDISERKVLLHYDMLRLWKNHRTGDGFETETPVQLLDRADRLTLVTVWTPPHELCARIHERSRFVRKRCIKNRRFRRAVTMARIHRRLRRLYRNPDELVREYERWLDYCRTYKDAAHWILDTTVEAELRPVADWPEIQRQDQR